MDRILESLDLSELYEVPNYKHVIGRMCEKIDDKQFVRLLEDKRFKEVLDTIKCFDEHPHYSDDDSDLMYSVIERIIYTCDPKIIRKLVFKVLPRHMVDFMTGSPEFKDLMCDDRYIDA